MLIKRKLQSNSLVVKQGFTEDSMEVLLDLKDINDGY